MLQQKVNRELFLHKLESVQPGLSSKDIVEQSGCVIFKDGEMITYNEHICCRSESLLGKFTGAVRAEKLLDILRKLPEDELEIEVRDDHLIFTGKKRRFGVVMEKEITLPIEGVEKPKEWGELHEDFGEAINIVGQCVGKDESKFLSVCVHIHPKWIEGLDDVQICRWRLETGLEEAVLARQSSIRHITSLGMNEFSLTTHWIHFRNPNNLILSCRRFSNEDYPTKAITKALEIEGEPTVLPKGLINAADNANIFSQENTENNRVLVKLMPGKVRIKGLGVSGWYSEWKKLPGYKGKEMEFLISPQLLMDLVKRHSECIISPERLKVDGGQYKYVTVLSQPQTEEENAQN